MEIVAYLPEVDEGRVAPGQPARVVLDTYPGQPMQGRVAEVSAVAQDVRYTSGFKVRIGLSAPDSRLLVPGLSARVEVTRRTLENALLVPRRAVFRDGGHARVRRVGYTPIEVEITSCLTLECVVTGGLTEGDRVLLR
jgi:multidrug efflux pump subunit AcrA (membrane-fusion protein)